VTQRIRGAASADAAEITAMIHELADFEGAPELCTVTEAQILTALFGEPATVRGQIADVDDQVVAMALWFPNFSTWEGVAGVYLEDLYVRPAYRRRGLARALLSALARECLDNSYTRLSWAVLDWNTDAIALYEAIGGQPQRQWITYRVSGRELAELAEPP
jgi:GNAT superfamily N-acetyltransferase